MYARFNKWRKNGSRQKALLNVSRLKKYWLDCSSVQLDGSHTSSKNGGAAVGYHGRKKARTTATLFLTDNQGKTLACMTPQTGNHHASFRLTTLFEELCVSLTDAGIAVSGLFLNAGSALDTTVFRQVCTMRNYRNNIARNHRTIDWHPDNDTFFDSELYRRRAVVEHPNPWLDSLKTLLVQYEKCFGN